jgi:hypothetical protein
MSPEQPKDNEPDNASASRAPCWNIVSIALLVLTIAVGLWVLVSGSSGRGDYYGAMGAAILLLIGGAAACGLGLIAAIIALIRGERMLWLTFIGLVGNAAVVVPVLGLFFPG